MEIEVFLALKSAGVPDADARHAATAIRSGVAEEVREAQKGVATTADIRTLESSISDLTVETKSDIRGLESSISDLKVETKSDIRRLESSISDLTVETKSDIRRLESSISDLRADFFQRLSDIHKSTVVVMCSSVGLLGVLVTVLKFVG
ncbi:hypothetical protein ACQ86G_01820 [Roseateles chitinivorans]|uniref:hypothetical protein n=1 Tax=Roseateles chitinivorans TaxID=2917965 RepID=UPI003D67E85F